MMGQEGLWETAMHLVQGDTCQGGEALMGAEQLDQRADRQEARGGEEMGCLRYTSYAAYE